MAANPLPLAEHPLVTRLVEHQGATRLDEATVEDFLAAPGEVVLFFTEDAMRFREVPDVAVIVPELSRAAVRPFRIGVLPAPLANALASRWAVRRWPALVFVRDGEWLGNVEGLRDWTEYLALANELLAGPTRPMPARVIPVATGPASCG